MVSPMTMTGDTSSICETTRCNKEKATNLKHTERERERNDRSSRICRFAGCVWFPFWFCVLALVRRIASCTSFILRVIPCLTPWTSLSPYSAFSLCSVLLWSAPGPAVNRFNLSLSVRRLRVRRINLSSHFLISFPSFSSMNGNARFTCISAHSTVTCAMAIKTTRLIL